jgi:hypothetical protein
MYRPQPLEFILESVPLRGEADILQAAFWRLRESVRQTAQKRRTLQILALVLLGFFQGLHHRLGAAV